MHWDGIEVTSQTGDVQDKKSQLNISKYTLFMERCGFICRLSPLSHTQTAWIVTTIMKGSSTNRVQTGCQDIIWYAGLQEVNTTSVYTRIIAENIKPSCYLMMICRVAINKSPPMLSLIQVTCTLQVWCLLDSYSYCHETITDSWSFQTDFRK